MPVPKAPPPAAPTPPAAVSDEDPVAALKAAKEREKDLQDQLARAMAKREVEEEEREIRAAERASRAPVTGDVPSLDRTDPGVSKPGNILIHFVDSGFSALGKIWVTGDEAEFDPSDPNDPYHETVDSTGWSWVNMTEGEQLDRHGKIIFRPGPWRGKSLAESRFEQLSALASEEGFDIPTAAELAASEARVRAAGRKPPHMPLRD